MFCQIGQRRSKLKKKTGKINNKTRKITSFIDMNIKNNNIHIITYNFGIII